MEVYIVEFFDGGWQPFNEQNWTDRAEAESKGRDNFCGRKTKTTNAQL